MTTKPRRPSNPKAPSICAVLFAIAACSCSSTAGLSATEGQAGDDAQHAITAPAPGKWTTLVSQEWELDPGAEGYWCKRITVAEDFWVSGMRSVAPSGTHHTTLGKDSGGPDGTFRCGGFSTGSELLYGSGVGTDSVELPTGLAIKVNAGEQLLLNLHVLNVTDKVLSQASAIEVLAVEDSAVVEEVGFVLAGVAGGLEVVPGESTQVGHCTMPVDVTVLSVIPHMHTRGVHQVVTATGAGAPLFDGPYAFSEQLNYWLEPAAVIPAEGRVDVTCTYGNETGRTLRFGEGTNDEMCFAGLYHYPRFTRGSTCQL